jgi:hypothetical protein
MDVRYDIDKENRIIIGIVSGSLDRDILMNLLAQLRIISSNNRGCNLLFDVPGDRCSLCHFGDKRSSG